MALEKTSLSSPTEGPWGAPFSMPGVGLYDQIRNLEAVYPGTAVSFKASTDQLDHLYVYKYGNALARPEFGGVVLTYSNSPDNLNPICTTNAAVISILKAGRAGIMLAPGQVVERDQYLEPIPSGPYQGLWQVAASAANARAQAMQAYDDSANADGDAPGRIITALVLPGLAGAGLIGAEGPSNTLTGTTSETEYTIGTGPTLRSVRETIPAYSLKVGDRLRIVFAIRAVNGASGATVFKAYLAGKAVAASLFYTSISTTPSAGDVVQVQADLYLAAASGSNNVSLSGTATVGTPGTATARSLGIFSTLDPTVDNTVTVTCTPNNNADQSQLLFLSVEKLA